MTQEEKKGALVISLDFELFWGMFDKTTIGEYGKRVLGERTAIPRMLDLFTRYGIHATWAGVGMLMARNKRELYTFLPPAHLQPTYEDMSVSAYRYIEGGHVGEDETSDPYHFGPTLVKAIIATPHQEFANHTFSHYYCIDGHKVNAEGREGGLGHENDIAIFARDLESHAAVSNTYGIETESIIFPRNQATEEVLRTCREKGIIAYRGNEDHFLYRARGDKEQSLFIRGVRLLDHYLNISGHHTYLLSKALPHLPVNVPASRFFRPWNRFLALLEPLRIGRIMRAMTHAAKNGEIFHLWWHPHNVGIDQEQNFRNLEKVLRHFAYLKDTYGMESLSMNEVARRAL